MIKNKHIWIQTVNLGSRSKETSMLLSEMMWPSHLNLPNGYVIYVGFFLALRHNYLSLSFGPGNYLLCQRKVKILQSVIRRMINVHYRARKLGLFSHTELALTVKYFCFGMKHPRVKLNFKKHPHHLILEPLHTKGCLQKCSHKLKHFCK